MNHFTATRRPAITQKWIFQKLLLQILNNWIWIVIVVVLSVTIAFLFNRYTDKVYASSVQLIKGSSDFAKQDPASIFGGGMQSSPINLKYEQAFITALPVLEEIVKELDLYVTYTSKGRLKKAERYGYLPIIVNTVDGANSIPYGLEFLVKSEDEVHYTLSTENEAWQEILKDRIFLFEEWNVVNGFSFQVMLRSSLEAGEWRFSLKSVEQSAKDLKWRIAVSEIRDGGYGRSRNSILQLSMQSSLSHKDRVILDALVEEIKKADIESKLEQSKRTITFIEDQLFHITDSMKLISAQMRSLKLSNKELTAGSSAIFGKITSFEEDKSRLLLENRYCDYLKEYIENSSNEEIIAPSTFGIGNDILGGLVSSYIELQLDIRELSELDIKSSVYSRDERQKTMRKEELEDLIIKSVGNTHDVNQIRVKEYEQQIDALFLVARDVLSEEIVLVDFERLYGLNENVFTMLMDKKAEAGISQASMISDYRTLEQAKTSHIPLKPKNRKNYMTALFLGLMLPISFLFLKTLNRNTILSLNELEEIVNLPVAGVIGYSQNPRTMIEAPQSLVAENFRSLRSNLRFVNGGSEQTIFVVTSSVSAEGKTYISVNLAASMALQGKKSVIVGADMRKPTLHNYFNEGPGPGLSQYLSGQASLDESTQSGGIDNLDVIFSGPIPPNPAELLGSKKMEELILALKKRYDIIFIDTPPIGLISDASEIFDITDSILLITRQQKTPVSTLQHTDHFMDEKSLAKSMLIFNGVRKGVGYGYYGYGYGYGYGNRSGYYTEDKKA